MDNEKVEDYSNFANHPQTISELQAQRTHSSEPWSPRDALVSILRDIDQEKLKVSSLIVVFDTVPEDNGPRVSTFYVAAVKGFHRAIGILDRARWLMHQG